MLLRKPKKWAQKNTFSKTLVDQSYLKRKKTEVKEPVKSTKALKVDDIQDLNTPRPEDVASHYWTRK